MPSGTVARSDLAPVLAIPTVDCRLIAARYVDCSS